MAAGSIYKYDIFLSYSSHDVEWAEKLETDLAAQKLNVYRDKKRLVAGTPWEPQLDTAMAESRHVVVLWSEEARAGDWVMKEAGRFDSRKHTGPGPKSDTLMFFISLDTDNRAFSDLQMIRELKTKGVYAAGFSDLKVNPGSQAIWQKLVNDIVTAVNGPGLPRPVPVAVLAMTQAESAALNPAIGPPFGESLDIVLPKIGLNWKTDVQPRYGPVRDDWRPFGTGTPTIGDLLDKIRVAINLRLRPEDRFRWDPLGDALWSSDFDTAWAEGAQLMGAPSVLVVDPISLHDQKVYRTLNVLKKCFDLPTCVIIVVPPFQTPAASVTLREHLRQVSAPLFNAYYEPPIPRALAFAVCGVNVGDDQDIQRLLRLGLGQRLASASGRPENVFTTPRIAS
jgi:hypothetical protein